MYLRIRGSDKILIVAPHPDDETIGCGGLLAKYGKQCDVLLVTDGRMGFFENSSVTDPDEMAKIRKNEFVTAMKFLNVNKTVCLDLPNGDMKPYISIIKRFNIKEYNKIFIPGCNEHHTEHVLVNRVLRRMILFQWSKAEVFEYEVWTPMLNPNKMIDITDVIDKKLDVVSIYKSQIECYDYVNLCKGLNMFRGCAHLLEYAEMYKRRQTLRGKVKKIYRKIHR